MNFADGDFVKKGQLLYEIDPKPYQAIEIRTCRRSKSARRSWNSRGPSFLSNEKLVKTGAASIEQFNESVANRDVALAELDRGRSGLTPEQLDLEYNENRSADQRSHQSDDGDGRQLDCDGP